MSFLSRIFAPSAVKTIPVEGAFRDGPWQLFEGWLPSSWGSWNFWQQGYNPLPSGTSAIVQACVSAYAQTIAMCPGSHWRLSTDASGEQTGGRDRVTTSALSRILRKPNAYQSISDFLLNLVRSLYIDGNAYAVAIRNDRFEITELHLMNPEMCAARIATTGDVFYALGGNEVIERQLGAGIGGIHPLSFVPARDVLHVRLDTPRNPLKGEPPLTSALIDIATSNAMAAQALAFFENQSRPSGTLNTDLKLTKDQVTELRELWNAQSQGLNAGGVPILSAGLKWNPMGHVAQDAQVAELMKFTDTRIASVFRVPLAILNLQAGQGPQGSTESLMQFWISTGLGFPLNHIEEAFGRMFGLFGWPDEYLEFDTAALLRSAFKDRIEALARGVQGGIYAPNEARAEVELPAAKFGDEPRVQQQVVPLSFWGQKPPKAPRPAPPITPDSGAPPPAPEKAINEGSANDNEQLRQSFRASHARTIAI